MSKLNTLGKALVGLAALLFVLGFIGGGGSPGGPEGAIALLVTGLLILAVTRFGITVPGIKRQLALDRQDVVAATDWSRIGKYTLRSSFGAALAASGVVLFVVALALQETTLAVTWAVVTVAGLLLLVVSWRFAHEITADHTHTLSVRAPDLFAVHSFHVALRQQAENLGYKVLTNASPGESGTPSAVQDGVFHAKGGFKARRRPIDESRQLVPELDDPYLGQILTVTTLGVFTLLLGVMVVSVGDELASSVPLLGIPLAFLGLVVIGYDYVTRTREWGELYCIEEGTIYAATLNKYEDDVLEAMDRGVNPTVSTAGTSAVLSVTVGAKCTSLYDEEQLEAEFETLVDAVSDATAEFEFDVTGDDGTVLTHADATESAEA